jgi:hypothetical protein
MIIHWLCYCTAVSMLSFLPVIVCGLLELKRICVGSLLIVWDGNESVQEFYYLLGVDANLCRIFIDCLEWKWISAWSSLLAWSGNESVYDFYCLLGVDVNLCRNFIACLECKWICAGYLLLVYVCIGVGDSVILLNPCILCACHKLRPGFSTSHVVVVYDLIWSEVVVSFVDICGIVDHHSLQLLFKIVRQKYSLIYNSISWR